MKIAIMRKKSVKNQSSKKIIYSDFQKRLFMIITWFLLILLLIASVMTGIYVYNNRLDNLQSYYQESVRSQAAKVDQLVQDMVNISIQVVASSAVQEVLMQLDGFEGQENYFENHPAQKQTLEKACSSINLAGNRVDAIYIFRSPWDFFSYNTVRYDQEKVESFFASDEYAGYIDCGDSYYKLTAPHRDIWTVRDPDQVISLIRPMITTYYNRKKIAMLEVQYRLEKLEKLFEETEKEGFSWLLVREDDQEVLYASAEELSHAKAAVLEAIRDEKLTACDPGSFGRAVGIRRQLAEEGWTLVGLRDRLFYVRSLYSIVGLIILMFALFGVIAVGGIYVVTERMTRPIRDLRESLSNITLEDVKIPDQMRGNNEIELLKDSFQGVLNQLQKSAIELQQAQNAQYEARIDAMQAQINPHFLYNSLMSISAAGQEKDISKVQEMCSQLGDLFRYVSSGGNQATMEQELENAEKYLTFMKYRYMDELSYRIERSGDETVMVPKLILQPVMENCFKHGFSNMEPPYRVGIRYTCQDGKWMAEVSDNGEGFPENAGELFLGREAGREDKDHTDRAGSIPDVSGEHMALRNIYVRLHAMYGSSMIFELENGENGGAVVRLGCL